MKTTETLVLTFILSLQIIFAQKQGITDISQTIEKSYLELTKIQVIPIKDSQTNRQYELYIKLPEGYSKSKDKKHPVIYYTDAMWHVEILSGSAEYIIEDAILVGISWQKDIDGNLKKKVGEYISRFRDYSFQKSSNKERQAKYQFGQANNHLNFIRNDVIKYVENNYRADINNRTYFGYSMGGEFGTYILLTQPDTFKNYILGSPSLSNNFQFLSKLMVKHKNLNANIFVSYGTLEKELGLKVDKFISMLTSREDKSIILKPMVIEGSHQTAFPMTGVQSMYWLSGLIK